MRMSCNGCRVLRKGCSDNCSIRPCLQWIKSPESQAHATVFLAKFYGRAGLMNLINAGPDHLRPAIFRSLLYEACGRIVNPIYGSVGLLWSGSWHLCQAAVEAVLQGAPIVKIASESAASTPVPPFVKPLSYDIRHVSKDDPRPAANDLHRVSKAGCPRFKRPGSSHRAEPAGAVPRLGHLPDSARVPPIDSHRDESSAIQASEPDSAGEAEDGGSGAPCAAADPREGESRENESAFSAETAGASMATSTRAEPAGKGDGAGAGEDGEVELELELTLGFEPAHHSPRSSSSSSSHSPSPSRSAPRAAEPPARCDRATSSGWRREVCSVNLGLHLAA